MPDVFSLAGPVDGVRGVILISIMDTIMVHISILLINRSRGLWGEMRPCVCASVRPIHWWNASEKCV